MTPEQIGELRKKHYNATVASLRLVNPELMIMRLRPDFAVPPHKPGQYSTLGLGYWEPRAPDCQEETLEPGFETTLCRRAYSMSCSILDEGGQLLEPARTDFLEFYIVLVRHSGPDAPGLTPRLFCLREGERLFVGRKITGHFTLDPVQPDDTVLFLATGTGEAPHNYMLLELLRRGHAAPIVSVCCVRYKRDLGYLPTHQELARRYANYSYLALTTREDLVAGKKVYIQDLITSGQLGQQLGRPLDPARTQVFLCGNPAMIGAPTRDRDSGQTVYPKPAGVIEILEGRGFRTDDAAAKVQGNIHFEKYW